MLLTYHREEGTMAGETILLADDDAMIVDPLALQLHREGFEVVVASDGEEALTQARALQPDVILLGRHDAKEARLGSVPRTARREQRAHHHAYGARRRNRPRAWPGTRRR